MEKIRITDRMAEGLLGSVTVGDHMELQASMVLTNTVCALIDRGLVTASRTRNHRLTDAGRYVHGYLVAGGTRRTFSLDELQGPATPKATTPTTAKCKSCGLRVADGSEYHESCRPATPKAMPGTIEPATTTLGKPVTDFQVKVWYASGSSETISHIDFMAAASIYGEAEDNPRAIAAEVHCPGGCLAASFTRQPVDTAGERG